MKMNRWIIFLITLISTAQMSFSQHCAFDGAYISVLRVIDADSQSIDGLKIYLLDSNDEVVQHYEYVQNGYKLDTFFFHKNPDSTSFKGYIDNNHPFHPSKFRFWFAEDNYVILNGFRDTSYTICITDPAGRFQTKKASIMQLGNFPLCTGMSGWDHGPEHRSFFKDYAPMLIQLNPVE